jgi:hypothetical protein
MPSSQILQELARKPRKEIEADLALVVAERERLQTEEVFLRTVLKLVGSADREDEASEPNDAPQSGRKPTARDHILAVMRPRGFEPWAIPGIIAAVQKRNPDAQPPAIRLALRRLEKDGVLMRDQHKNYRLDPQRHGGLVVSTS